VLIRTMGFFNNTMHNGRCTITLRNSMVHIRS
jgi:hypothetical protein